MTRVEFFFNVPDKLAKTADLCEKAVAKGRQLTVFSHDHATNEALQRQLWQHSATSFLASGFADGRAAEDHPIVLHIDGAPLIQDDVLINLHHQTPTFFSRFRYLVELVGVDEPDKISARMRFKFYRDRGYEVKSTNMVNH